MDGALGDGMWLRPRLDLAAPGTACWVPTDSTMQTMLEVARGIVMRAAGSPTFAATNNSDAKSQVVNRCLNLGRVSHSRS